MYKFIIPHWCRSQVLRLRHDHGSPVHRTRINDTMWHLNECSRSLSTRPLQCRARRAAYERGRGAPCQPSLASRQCTHARARCRRWLDYFLSSMRTAILAPIASDISCSHSCYQPPFQTLLTHFSLALRHRKFKGTAHI